MLILGVLALLILAATDGRLIVRCYEVTTEKLTGSVRLAVLSDLHNGQNTSEVLTLTQKNKPDAVLMVGDMFPEPGARDISRTLDMMAALASEVPCYYVSGNHEYWAYEMPTLRERIQETGVQVVEGQAVTLTVRGQKIQLCGLPDPYGMKYEQILDTRTQLTQLAARAEEGVFTVLLAHRPELAETYAEYGFDLVVSGHAHGGQVRIPYLLNGLYAPNQGWFPKYAGGPYEIGSMTLIVSRGLGAGNPLPRVFDRPEVVLIDLRGK